MRKSGLLTLLLFGFTALSWGQTFTVTTLAGANPAVNAAGVPSIVLYAPEAVHIDAAGNIYIADSGGRRIYKINPTTNAATAIVGNGVNGNTDSVSTALGTNIQLPTGMATDAAGNLYFSDRAVARIKKIDTAGKLSSIAGENVPGSGNFGSSNATTGDGYPSPTTSASTALASSVNSPRGMCIDINNNLIWADTTSNRVKKMNLNTSVILTVAGSVGGPTIPGTFVGSQLPGDGGPAILARLNAPEDVACGPDGSIYIADTGDNRIRKIDRFGMISTIAGSNTLTNAQQAVNNVNNGGNTTLSLSTTSSCTSSGNATCGDGKLGTQAQFNSPAGVKLDANGNLLIADRFSNRIRALNLSTGVISTLIAGNLNTPGRFAIDATGRLFIPEMGLGGIGAGTHVVKIYDPSTNALSVFAGINHFSGDAGSQATGALFNQPTGIAVDSKGIVYVSDSGNNRVRKIDTTGAIYTVVGTGVAGNNNSGNASQVTTFTIGNGVAGTGAKINNPKGLAVDAADNLYIADTGNHRILMMNATDGTVSTVVGVPASSSSNTTTTGADGVVRITATTYGEGQAASVARLNAPQGVAVDKAGNIYIADTGNHAIRMASADLTSVTTIGGIAPVIGGAFPAGASNYQGYEGDNGPATSALFSNPTGIWVNADGTTVLIVDSSNLTVRRITGTGKIINTIAGVAASSSGDSNTGYPAYAVRNSLPATVVQAADGTIYYTDSGAGRIKAITPGTLIQYYPLGNSGNSGAGATSSTLLQSTPSTGINWSADVANSPTTAVRLSFPWGLAIDASNAVYVVDGGNGQVRKMTKN